MTRVSVLTGPALGDTSITRQGVRVQARGRRGAGQESSYRFLRGFQGRTLISG
jgi:hypothetical protein